MKKIFSVLLVALAAFALVSCEKTPKPVENKLPVVSISADASFNAENKAQLTLSLSEAAKTNVVVKLAKASVQAGKEQVLADFEKNVTIEAGQTSKVIVVAADVLGLTPGEYQTAITIASAEGAEVAQNATAYINFTFVVKPYVNLYAENSFASNKTAKLQITLSEAALQDVVVNLAKADGNIADISFDASVTIPAGQTEKEIEVSVAVAADQEIGVFPGMIKIASVSENALVGNAANVTINLIYPFPVNITMDGQFSDWADPSIATWTLPEGLVMYESMKVMKITGNDKYVYVYLEFTDPGFSFNMPFDMFLDADGNPNTGAVLTSTDNQVAYLPYSDGGLEYYIELALHDVDHYNDFYSWGGVYKYAGADGAGVFSNLSSLTGSYTGAEICANGALTDGIGRLEIQLSRTWFGIKNNKVRIGVKNMDGANDWACYGLLPQGNCTDKNDPTSRTQVGLAEAILPSYNE